MRLIAALLAAAAMLAACGYKSALYLPQPEAQRPAPATAKEAASAPAKDAAPAQ